ncbi:MAG TPA: methyltransferase domain-containing protein [Pyrinomonadaceae bacterium]|nr:methyltransferase domain-containing protein [Pyrinomonadaceae bacterium]
MNDNMLDVWAESARHWTKYSDTLHKMFVPLTHALIERARIGKGQTVLDVAGGAGEPSLTIAEVVGPEGSVMCTDGVAQMVEAARAEAQRRGLTNMRFQQCPADSLPFPDNSFDVVVSRLGVMFFPDPVAAFREMLRVLRPNGRMAFAVWAKSDVNPFCYLVTRVLDQHVQSPAAAPDAPNAFRFAEPGKLINVMKQAGAVDVAESIVNFDIEAPISARQFWEIRSHTSDTLRDKLAKLPADEQAQIGGEIEQAVAEFFPNNQMKFPTQMLIATATKPPAD